MGPHQISFFAYYMWPPSSVSTQTTWGSPSDQDLCILYEGRAPQISFFAYYYGGPSDQFLRLLYGPPQTCFFAYYMEGGALQISLFAYYRAPSLRSVSSFIICGPLMSVSSLTAGRGHQISSFAYSMGAYLKLFFHILYGGPLRSVASLNIWGLPRVGFSSYYKMCCGVATGTFSRKIENGV